MQEAARVQGIQIGEGGRVQGLEAAGKQFVFGAHEAREMQQLDRVSAQLSGAQGRAMQASADRRANQAGLIGGLASIGGNLLTGLASRQANAYDNSASLPSGSTGFTDNLNGGMFNVNTGGGFDSSVGQLKLPKS